MRSCRPEAEHPLEINSKLVVSLRRQKVRSTGQILKILPILKPGPCTNNNVAWQLYLRLDLYHRCMEKVIAEINDHCSEDRHFRFADGKVREGQCFWHLLSMDGLEISYTAMCPTNDCPVCERPKDELDRTDKSYYHLC